MNKDLQLLLKQIIDEKSYDSTQLSINTTKTIEEIIYHASNKLKLDYDNTANILIMLGEEKIYNN